MTCTLSSGNLFFHSGGYVSRNPRQGPPEISVDA